MKITKVDSICYNYEVFNSDQKVFLDIINELKEVPSEGNLCDSDQVFDFSRYARLTAGEKNMRAVCYPVYNDLTSSEIPGEDANLPMLKVDYEDWRIKWNERIVDDERVLNKVWSLIISENSDEDHFIGLNSTAKFTSKKVRNEIFNL
jgi:hypothetical protein